MYTNKRKRKKHLNNTKQLLLKVTFSEGGKHLEQQLNHKKIKTTHKTVLSKVTTKVGSCLLT